MQPTPGILCIGSVLRDTIGRAPVHVQHGSDLPGRITRRPGGVAMNIAVTLPRFGLRPALLAAIGLDAPAVSWSLAAALDAAARHVPGDSP